VAALIGGLIGLFAWSPWVKPTEVEWLGAYESWSAEVEEALQAGFIMPQVACEAAYDDEVGDPPKERLAPVSAAARRGCADLSPRGLRNAEVDVVRALMAVHGDLLPPRQRRDFSEIARSSVGVRANVYCWQPDAWTSFSQHYEVVRGGEEASLKGIADSARNRIDLDPGVCATLGRYLERVRPSPLTYQNFELAEALSVLTHQAEHLKAPSASEAEVECYAVQHVRPLVDAGWGTDFATEIALHAWEISYTQLPPQFRSRACRSGGRLDRNPTSDAWP
jgi:hypothetical protein